MDLKEYKTKAKLIRDNDIYRVYDFPLQDLVVSMTVLHPGKATTGHAHKEAEEVYFFLEGKGKIQINRSKQKVKRSDLIFLKKGAFHKVFNISPKDDLIFLSVFEKYGKRK